jgi:hypothetical protein
MRSLFRALAFLTIGWAAWGVDKPNFNGTWKLKSDDGFSQVQTYYQDETWVRVVQRIQGPGVDRTIDTSAAIDGKPHQQTVEGYPCTMIAKWDGDALIWETRRETAGGILHYRRRAKLAADGKSITAVRTQVLPEPNETRDETWEKMEGKGRDRVVWNKWGDYPPCLCKSLISRQPITMNPSSLITCLSSLRSRVNS